MILEHLKVGAESIRHSRLRSFFTTLGIIIGVVGVVTVVSLGEGVKSQLSSQASDLGSNLISVRPGEIIKRDSKTGRISSVNIFASTGSGSLIAGDVDVIRKIPGVETAVSMSSVSGVPVYNGNKFNDGTIISADPALSKIMTHKVDFGTYLNDEDAEHKNTVIGSNVAQKLFNESVPIGKSLEIRGQKFLVQGVFASFSQPPINTGNDMNNAVFISDSMAKQLLGNPAPIYQILIKKSASVDSSVLIKQIDQALVSSHYGQHDFNVLDQQEAGAVSGELFDLLTKMIIATTGITLLIGGIGIMNVMLASVSERRREIGIRKAIGATNNQIRTQFMLESAILSIWGVIFGVIVAGLLHLGLRIFTDLEPVLSWQPIIISGCTAVLVGIIFGSIPAVRAARKDPIESFRA